VGEARVASRLSDSEIYTKHRQELMRFATFLVGPADAADVLSSAVLNALAAPSWPAVVEHRAYLYRAVLNEARQHHRRIGRSRPSSDPVDHVAPPDVWPEVLAAVKRLSPQQRAVVFLTYWHDHDRATVARTLAVSDGTVRRQLARAHRRLRKELDERAT
jgi:DNA-directed RNA polymerase specialized sigma24 family protein